jgi:SAM-dependent methyltransferase
VKTDTNYLSYVTDARHMKSYAEYQQRYAGKVRESDKVLIGLVRDVVGTYYPPPQSPALLDIGCSTGNLLRHLKHQVPGLRLRGGDLARAVIAGCRADPGLADIAFAELNVLDLAGQGPVELITANAILCVLDQAEFDAALRNIAGALKPGGWFLAFDWLHPFEQEIAIEETTRGFPGGFRFYWRGFERVERALSQAGFDKPLFKPFSMPVDLERPADPGDVTSYTVKTAEGRRLSFRGALCQPWCHLTARKVR